ncbi:hypothetical protein EPYR_03907 [Erwinia pyrifoliae DSM 12163]|nr:hypothetical protein EPYR_03907 [Erwinia pyrifoliae DSM 12163]
MSDKRSKRENLAARLLAYYADTGSGGNTLFRRLRHQLLQQRDIGHL